MQTSLFGLVQCLLHDFGGDAVDLDIHLQGGNAFGCASDLEIHVAEMIFVAKNIGQYGKAVIFLDQAHRDTGDRSLQGHTGIHQCQARATDAGHGG